MNPGGIGSSIKVSVGMKKRLSLQKELPVRVILLVSPYKLYLLPQQFGPQTQVSAGGASLPTPAVFDPPLAHQVLSNLSIEVGKTTKGKPPSS